MTKPDERPRRATTPQPIGSWPINLVKRIFYWKVQLIVRLVAVGFFDYYCINRHHCQLPSGALILSTHQSHLDPVLIGVTFTERLNYLARRTLFNNRLLGLVITLLDAIELDRDRTGIAGLKETIRRLKVGKKVLVFPEGTRSPDGQLAPLKPGFLSVARRSKVPLLPVAITGAFEALPRTEKLPLRYPIRLSVGAAITPDVVASLKDPELLELITERLQECRRVAELARR